MTDHINPDHYKATAIECIEYQKAVSTPTTTWTSMQSARGESSWAAE